MDSIIIIIIINNSENKIINAQVIPPLVDLQILKLWPEFAPPLLMVPLYVMSFAECQNQQIPYLNNKWIVLQICHVL